MKLKKTAIVVVLAFGLSGCLASPSETGGDAGFLLGLWHGAIALISFVISLFNDNVGIYEAQNKGGLYDLGFIIGVMIFWGGSGSAAKR